MKVKSFLGIIALLIISGILSFIAIYGIGELQIFGIKTLKLGLDLNGGVSIVYQAEKDEVTEEEMASAVSLIQRRLDRNGWTEGEASKQGENRIRVEIPGVADAETAVRDLGETAQLVFTDEEGRVLLTGSHIKKASMQVGQSTANQPASPYVSLEFNSTGKELFAIATSTNVGKQVAIVMDGEVISAPVVNAPIEDGHAMITGSFTSEDAQLLAEKINEGSLPFNLSVIEMEKVGARLGANAVDASITASIVGILLVFAFMLLAYKGCGIAADIALIIYIAADVLLLNFWGVTLTLPGVAGIILSVGMAVDANIIIFERLKEELRAGKSARSAVNAGFARALPAILDGNITTFIASTVLFFMGTGALKGFAQTLMIGIGVSMFTAIVITRFALRCLLGMGIKNPKFYGVKAMKGGEA